MSAISFTEIEHPDGRIQIRWDCETPREWQRVLTLIKSGIPMNGRAFDKATKTWIIGKEFRSLYEKVKLTLSVDESESLDLVDEAIDTEIMANLLNHNIGMLPPSMRRRAIFAIRAALGVVEAPVEFCISRGVFGAYNDIEKVWCYEDGRYSSASPSERDEKAEDKAYERLDKATAALPEIMGDMDKPLDQAWKIKFRAEMLAAYDYKCYVCKRTPKTLSRLHMHRVTPGKNGGLYTRDNVVVVCSKCHSEVEGHDWPTIKAWAWDGEWDLADGGAQ